ncbi:hypothetical protein ScPMuIL_012918 [Solemya velum]
MLSLTLKSALSQLREGKTSAKELCEKCIERAAKLRELNALVTETFQIARSQAEHAAAGYSVGSGEPGPLAGIPVAVKDNFCTKGVRTSCASHMLQNYAPPYNATMVQKMADGGAVLIGKTNLDEYGMGSASVESIYGATRNPWKYRFSHRNNVEFENQVEQSNNGPDNENNDLYTSHPAMRGYKGSLSERMGDKNYTDWHVAGGSSGGSAVAVASGICFGALGSDTGGSTRNPASYCGIVGLKSTYGLLSRHGLIPLVNSMDVPGIFSRSVDDAAILLNCLAGHDVFDSTTVPDEYNPIHLPDDISVKGLHIGIPKEYHAPGTSADVIDAWRKMADMFDNAGAKVSQVSLPHTQYSILCYSVLCCCEVASNMARYDGIEFGLRTNDMASTEQLYADSRHKGFNDVVRGRIFAGNYFLLRKNYERYFLKAQRVRRLISDDFRTVFNNGVDLLLTPTTLSDAPRHDWYVQEDNRTRSVQQDVYTQPINLAGVPAVTVPICLSCNGLPIGLQLIGQHFGEKQMLLAAKWMEQQCCFPSLNLDFLDQIP